MLAAAALQVKQVIIIEKTNNATHEAMFLIASKQSPNINSEFSKPRLFLKVFIMKHTN